MLRTLVSLGVTAIAVAVLTSEADASVVIDFRDDRYAAVDGNESVTIDSGTFAGELRIEASNAFGNTMPQLTQTENGIAVTCEPDGLGGGLACRLDEDDEINDSPVINIDEMLDIAFVEMGVMVRSVTLVQLDGQQILGEFLPERAGIKGEGIDLTVLGMPGGEPITVPIDQVTGNLHFDALPEIAGFFKLSDFAVQSIEVVEPVVVPAAGHASTGVMVVFFGALLARSVRRGA